MKQLLSKIVVVVTVVVVVLRLVFVWRFGLVVGLTINVEFTLRRARLVPGWVTAFGWVNYLSM